MSHFTQQHASTRKDRKSKGHYTLYFPKWHSIARHKQHRPQPHHAHASTIYGGKYS